MVGVGGIGAWRAWAAQGQLQWARQLWAEQQKECWPLLGAPRPGRQRVGLQRKLALRVMRATRATRVMQAMQAMRWAERGCHRCGAQAQLWLTLGGAHLWSLHRLPLAAVAVGAWPGLLCP